MPQTTTTSPVDHTPGPEAARPTPGDILKATFYVFVDSTPYYKRDIFIQQIHDLLKTPIPLLPQQREMLGVWRACLRRSTEGEDDAHVERILERIARRYYKDPFELEPALRNRLRAMANDTTFAEGVRIAAKCFAGDWTDGE